MTKDIWNLTIEYFVEETPQSETSQFLTLNTIYIYHLIKEFINLKTLISFTTFLSKNRIAQTRPKNIPIFQFSRNPHRTLLLLPSAPRVRQIGSKQDRSSSSERETRDATHLTH